MITKIEDYKGRTIAKEDGSIVVMSPDGCKFYPGVDDSKSCGNRRFVKEANTLATARVYIDHLHTKGRDDFKITPEQEKWIEEQLDDTAGYLVKMSTLKYLIEKFVNEEIKNRTPKEDTHG